MEHPDASDHGTDCRTGVEPADRADDRKRTYPAYCCSNKLYAFLNIMGSTIIKVINKFKEGLALKYSLKKVDTFKNIVPPESYLLIKQSSTETVSVNHYVGETNIDLKCVGNISERYIAIVNNASIIGASNCIISGSNLLYDLLAQNEKRYNITDVGLFRILNSPVHFKKRYICCYKSKGEDIPSGIYLGGNYSGNFYHFVYEFIAKFYLLSLCPLPDRIPIIVDSIVKRVPQFKDLLAVFSQRNIIYVDRLEYRKVRKLFYISFVNQIPPNFKHLNSIKNNDVVFDAACLRYLRQHFLSIIPKNINVDSNRRIFISRKASKWRKYNEEEVISILLDHGYEVVYPETLTINEQFSLFYNVSHIIAASGAALTNIICCRPNTKVLILTSARLEFSIFSTIAEVFKLELNYLVGKITSYNNVQSDFYIDCSVLRRYLNEQ